MNLSFKTKWPQRMGAELAGKPNYFVEKILRCLFTRHPEKILEIRDLYSKLPKSEFISFLEALSYRNDGLTPKFHTIREDKKGRWKAGNKIHFQINPRSPQQFRFAPIIKCISIQKIEFEWIRGACRIVMDGKTMSPSKIETLAINDGFPSVEAFFQYFNEGFTGKIIHWTDLRY